MLRRIAEEYDASESEFQAFHTGLHTDQSQMAPNTRLAVMLSTHLAELYHVEPRALVQAVKRNADRFPEDFMFQLSAEETENLKSQFVISSWGGARRATPYAFTEQGVAMLSSVLKSKRASAVNIAIVRPLVRLRQLLPAETPDRICDGEGIDDSSGISSGIEGSLGEETPVSVRVFQRLGCLVRQTTTRSAKPRRL